LEQGGKYVVGAFELADEHARVGGGDVQGGVEEGVEVGGWGGSGGHCFAGGGEVGEVGEVGGERVVAVIAVRD
jgi:hypothetical protein